jgi:hypothetical protein
MPLDSVPLSVASLPGIVAGPVLRRLTRQSVSVWVACVAPDAITLKVRRHSAGGGGPETTVTTQPTRVGANLWMTVLTAAAPGGTFQASQIYEYELTAPWEGSARGPIPWPDLSLAPATRPTFLAPPAGAAELVVYHTSCRKPHGGGRDGLSLALPDLAKRFDPAPPPQPHLLVMSGDQIYADEVGHPLMPRVLRVARDLIGVDETDVFGPLPAIGGRGPGTRALGYTGATANQLWTYGEFMAMYLLAWSPVLWPATLLEFPTTHPIPPDVDPDVSKESWDEDRLNVGLFRTALPRVRKVLANVPSLMIFDDHEITDDWNIDLPWVNTVYPKPAGRRAVTNGLLASTLCQHWGNKPEAFTTAGTPEQRILSAVSSAAATSPPTSAATTCRPLLGIPGAALGTAPPAKVLRDLTTAGAIRYDVTLGPPEGWPVRIVLLDERTVREYPRTDSRGARISRAALAVQLPPPSTPVPFTIVVAAAPVLGSELVENVLQPLFQLIKGEGGARFADFESWSAVTANHQDLLARLAAHHPVVLLSGDVHYGFTSRLTRTEGAATTRAAQLTASAAKNLEVKNAAISIFSELAMRLGLERVRDTSGFASLTNADQTKLLSAPATGTALAWDDARDVLLGRVVRDGTSAPTAIPTPVAEAYGLATPGWTYEVEPVDDPMKDYHAQAVDPPWAGWDPAKALKMTAALQDADLERFARMFVGLPQFAVVTFKLTGSSLTVLQELRCPVGSVEPGPPDHVIKTEVVLT